MYKMFTNYCAKIKYNSRIIFFLYIKSSSFLKPTIGIGVDNIFFEQNLTDEL